jgi:SAM-dependent methyltransferase
MPDATAPESAFAAETRRIWDAKAEFWDGLMGEDGNEFYRAVVRPAQSALLALQPGETLLDLACGSGLASREWSSVAARVVGCDVSPNMIDLARRRAEAAGFANIEYRVVDATDEAELRALGTDRFDAVLCSMALMDIPAIVPLMRATHSLLKHDGRFVFALMHPCFNHQGARVIEDLVEHDALVQPRFGIQVTAYRDVPPQRGLGAPGEPEPHYYFHRTLARLFGAAFGAGFVLDGLEEPAYPVREPTRRSFDWANYHQIPPVLVARLRPSR